MRALVVAVVQSIGVYLFASGFLCTRQELSDIASCADSQAMCPQWLPCSEAYTGPQGCDHGATRTVPDFRFVVLLIVDALRFDFAPEFPTIAKALHERPDQSRLYQFVADPPTTTMQRLKGLTTGGLPTFVDIGRSFDAGIDIQEDNWVHGAMRAGHRVSVVGDDTWVSLFPSHRITKAQPYPSLNVKDIDGCDSHVKATLPEELSEAARLPPDQRSVVVGHFLGVDHIGHRFGIEHPEMRRKVADMDAVLSETMEWVDDQKRRGNGDSLLLLFGDHGQTVTGDHGGATPEEVESLLFAYSSATLAPLEAESGRPHAHAPGAAPQAMAPIRDFFWSGIGIDHKLPRQDSAGYSNRRPRGLPPAVPRIWQTDLVPMMSLWLAMPIPFGNLGAVVPSLIPSTGVPATDAANLLAATRNNAEQVLHFLATYQQATGGSLPADFVQRAQALNASLLPSAGMLQESEAAASQLTSSLREVLVVASSGARHAWASFDEARMAAGVVVLLAAAGGAAARVAAVWHRALGAARRQALPCSDLENGAPGVTVGSTSTRGPRALAPAGLRSTSPPAVPQGGARRPPHSLQARAASQSRRSPISSIPLKAASEGESVGGSAGLPAASGIGARARSPHLRADAPASCRVHHGDAPSPVPEAAVLQVHFLDACRMRRAMAVCLATHCAALFSNSYILAGRAVAHFLFTTLLLLWAGWVVGARHLAHAEHDFRGRGSAKRARSPPSGRPWPQGPVPRRHALSAVLAMLVLSRLALSYVARSHEKGVQEASSSSVHAFFGMLCIILALESGAGPRGPAHVHTRARDCLAMRAARIVSLASVAVFWALQLSQRLESASAWVRLGLPRLVYLLALAQLWLWHMSTPAPARDRRDLGAWPRATAGRERGKRTPRPGRGDGTAEAQGVTQAASWPRAWLVWPLEVARLVDPLAPAVESLIPSAALIFGADSAPVLAAAIALVRLTGFVADRHPLGPLLAELLGCQVATLLFYGTGHRPTFDGIQYGAAFVGIDDVSVNEMAHACAFLLTVLNTMGSWLLVALACVSASYPSLAQVLDLDSRSDRGAMMQLVYAVSLAMTSLFVALERRHLMVWAIFAPKLVYEIATTLVTNCVLLTALLASAMTTPPWPS